MARVVLQEQQRELLRQERQIASELQGCLFGFEGADASATTLRQVTETLDEMFLLVVVGEFNSGKSACINALLHENVLEEGVVLTTSQIIMRYGEKSEQSQRERALLELHYTADFLQDISIVDTPGTNAIKREHERLTEEFIPRSDLILFITSVDRPFTQSERAFLERIRTWGKKVIIVLNKIDILQTAEGLVEVESLLRENCRHLLGFQLEIFPVSALQAQQARTAIGHRAVELWESSRFGPLEDYLFRTLDEKERVRLKLLSPLGVPQHTSGSPNTPALLLLGLTKLLVIKHLILLVVRLNERVISPIGKGEAIPIAEVAIDCQHLAFPLDVRLLVIEQDIHHKRPIRGDVRGACHPLERVDLDDISHLGRGPHRFLLQRPVDGQPCQFITIVSSVILLPFRQPTCFPRSRTQLPAHHAHLPVDCSPHHD
jgi:small GTP-binding protein